MFDMKSARLLRASFSGLFVALAVLSSADDVAGQTPPDVSPLAKVEPAPARSSPVPAATVPSPAIQPAIPVPPEIITAIADLATQLLAIEKSIDTRKDHEEALSRHRDELDELATAAQRISEPLSAPLQAIRLQIEKLGPPPGKDAPPDTLDLALERQRLNGSAAEHDTAIKKAELLQVRARQLTGRIQELRHQLFARDLLRRTQSPLRPAVWSEVGREAGIAINELADIGRGWWDRVSSRLWELAAIVGVATFGYLLLKVGLAALALRWQRSFAESAPSFFARAAVAAVQAPALALPSLAALTALYATMDERGLLGLRMGWLAEGLFSAVIGLAVISALTTAILEPKFPRWRLFDLSDDSARRLSRLVQMAAAIYALDGVMGDVIRNLSLTLPIGIATSTIATLSFAGVLIALVRTPFEPMAPLAGEPRSLYWPRWLKLPLLALAVLVIAAALAGYVALGRFVAGQILITGSGLMLLFLFHLAIRALASQPIDNRRTVGQLLESRLGLDAERRSQLSTLLVVVLNVALALIGAPLLLLSWGFSLPEILGWLKSLVFGFEVGQFRISLARIMIALGLFLGLVFITRLLQGWLDARVFKGAKFDPGVSHSVRTGVGYAGFALAGLAAVSYAGLDISNIAIVAGALSVGIGFGLQSIVNNFVSGLILLVERPIKVGDWIVLKDREGIVRNISVRATEIETFDRASLIVPNSELITGSVMNWTHRNSVGRVVIKVAVSYKSDPELVRRLLLQVAERNTKILRHPPPIVALDKLGDHGLEFSLRAFLGDIMDNLEAQTLLRIEILKELKAAGIEIPYPQADIHLRDLDGLRQALALAFKSRQPFVDGDIAWPPAAPGSTQPASGKPP